MTHLPLDPFSLIALACAATFFVADRLRRRRERAHWTRLLQTAADIGANERGRP